MRDHVKRFFAPLVTDLGVQTSGWASLALAASIRRTVLAGVAEWQTVMVISTFVSLGASGWALAIGGGLLAATALRAMRASWTRHLWVMPVAMASLGVAGYLASGDIASVLAFSASWQLRFAACVAGLILFSRWTLPVTVVGAMTISILVLRYLPEWGSQLPSTIAVTLSLIIVAIRIALPSLLHLAERADVEEATADRARTHAEISHRVSAQLAEEARVLHDTAINTLGAIATGGAGVRNVRQVQAECARNLSVLRALRGEQERSLASDESFRTLFELPGVTLHRTGLDDAALERVSRDLGAQTVTGMTRAAREAVTNAHKHADASRIEVTVADTGRELRIEIRDDGTGFDPGSVESRGLSQSIFGRAEALGFTAALTSSSRAGTTVTLAAASGPHETPHPTEPAPGRDASPTRR